MIHCRTESRNIKPRAVLTARTAIITSLALYVYLREQAEYTILAIGHKLFKKVRIIHVNSSHVSKCLTTTKKQQQQRQQQEFNSFIRVFANSSGLL
jgi:hypothetical protein